MEWLIAGIISISMHCYSFYTIGDLKSERDQYREIAESCATDRRDAKRSAIEASGIRAKAERESTKEQARQQLDDRGARRVAVQGYDDSCLSAVSVFSGDIVDRRKRAINKLNANRLRIRP